MQFKLFAISVKGDSTMESELNSFLRGRRVLAVRRELVQAGEGSFWSFCVEYLDGIPAAAGRGNSGDRGPKVDYREQLKPDDFAVFSRLRAWRKETADREAAPVYTIFTNGQLARMAQERPQALAGLRGINGVGDARVEKYGSELLNLLRTASAALPADGGVGEQALPASSKAVEPSRERKA